jgi:L-amino acid N-acyltransferase YncA
MGAPDASEQLIRPVGAEDLEAIASIYAYYVTDTFVTFQTSVPTLEHWLAKWRSALASNHPWLISERLGEICGYATTSTFNPKPAYDPTVETSIYLHRKRVGEGLGRGLYERLLREASERSFHLAVAGIALPNDRSVALHESLGFRKVGVFEQVGYKLSGWRDVGWWQRLL